MEDRPHREDITHRPHLLRCVVTPLLVVAAAVPRRMVLLRMAVLLLLLCTVTRCSEDHTDHHHHQEVQVLPVPMAITSCLIINSSINIHPMPTHIIIRHVMLRRRQCRRKDLVENLRRRRQPTNNGYRPERRTGVMDNKAQTRTEHRRRNKGMRRRHYYRRHDHRRVSQLMLLGIGLAVLVLAPVAVIVEFCPGRCISPRGTTIAG
mmetsp:Transcript_2054/g.4743  ORF Transcript_2054/g.4743 Transcript_2054/m.4743 type:complete len:206 (-) Transcript_2054:3145-3762(-)